MICIIDGCEREAVARQMCLMHYKRARKGKDPRVDYVPERRPIRERFFEKVNVGSPSDCWLWSGATCAKGYGRIAKGGDSGATAAHRVSWIIHHGEIPKGMCVLHRCDNPPCVNPGHLFLGTIEDNNKDMWSKGRGKGGLPPGYDRSGWNMRKGSRHPNSKLSESDVRAIRRSSLSSEALAESYGVSRHTVWGIRTGKTWRHVA